MGALPLDFPASPGHSVDENVMCMFGNCLWFGWFFTRITLDFLTHTHTYIYIISHNSKRVSQCQNLDPSSSIYIYIYVDTNMYIYIYEVLSCLDF